MRSTRLARRSSHTLNGTFTLRLAVGNIRTTETQVHEYGSSCKTHANASRRQAVPDVAQTRRLTGESAMGGISPVNGSVLSRSINVVKVAGDCVSLRQINQDERLSTQGDSALLAAPRACPSLNTAESGCSRWLTMR